MNNGSIATLTLPPDIQEGDKIYMYMQHEGPLPSNNVPFTGFPGFTTLYDGGQGNFAVLQSLYKAANGSESG